LRQPLRVGAQRIGGIGREDAGLEHAQAGEGEPFRAAEFRAGRLVAVAPIAAGAGVEQHRHGGEVECRARAGGRIAPRRSGGALAPQVAPANDEMAPAGVERHGEIGIICPHHVGDDDRGGGEPIDVDGEMVEAPVEPGREHVARALAHRGGAQQGQGRPAGPLARRAVHAGIVGDG
jgi:hypothetical protein